MRHRVARGQVQGTIRRDAAAYRQPLGRGAGRPPSARSRAPQLVCPPWRNRWWQTVGRNECLGADKQYIGPSSEGWAPRPAMPAAAGSCHRLRVVHCNSLPLHRDSTCPTIIWLPLDTEGQQHTPSSQQRAAAGSGGGRGEGTPAERPLLPSSSGRLVLPLLFPPVPPLCCRELPGLAAVPQALTGGPGWRAACHGQARCQAPAAFGCMVVIPSIQLRFRLFQTLQKVSQQTPTTTAASRSCRTCHQSCLVLNWAAAEQAHVLKLQRRTAARRPAAAAAGRLRCLCAFAENVCLCQKRELHH